MYQSLVMLLALLPTAPGSDEYFRIRVVDDRTGRGVPLVELKTVNRVRYYTDSNGLVAFYEPGLMGRDVFFHVSSHGYEFPKDGFGYRGQRLKVTAGGEATLRIKRINIAQRLYRITGGGIYRDTVLVGRKPPIKQPVLNGQVFGSDSVVNTVYRGKIYWFWGDTNRPSYPLGNFHVPGATSLLPEQGGLDPDVGIDLDYFTDQRGFAKATCKMPGPGPTWINGLVVVKDKDNRERLFAKYVKVKPPLSIYQQGLVEFNDEKKQFEKRLEFDKQTELIPGGHPFHHSIDGVQYVYFGGAYPLVRVRATPEALTDPKRYETYTYFQAGASDEKLELERDGDGKLRYAWRTGGLPMTAKRENRLIKEGRIQQVEVFFNLRDVETDKKVNVHSSSVAWNAYRRKWVMIALETFGASLLGEVWYSEAPQPTGPWRLARKLVTHNKYSFYNPKQHAMLAKGEGKIIYFEATYTNMFSGNPDQTPRYNYNQIMYRVDLADPRLARELFEGKTVPE